MDRRSSRAARSGRRGLVPRGTRISRRSMSRDPRPTRSGSIEQQVDVRSVEPPRACTDFVRDRARWARCVPSSMRLEHLDACLGLGILSTLHYDPSQRIDNHAELGHVIGRLNRRMISVSQFEHPHDLVVTRSRARSSMEATEAALINAAPPPERGCELDVRNVPPARGPTTTPARDALRTARAPGRSGSSESQLVAASSRYAPVPVKKDAARRRRRARHHRYRVDQRLEQLEVRPGCHVGA